MNNKQYEYLNSKNEQFKIRKAPTSIIKNKNMIPYGNLYISKILKSKNKKARKKRISICYNKSETKSFFENFTHIPKNKDEAKVKSLLKSLDRNDNIDINKYKKMETENLKSSGIYVVNRKMQKDTDDDDSSFKVYMDNNNNNDYLIIKKPKNQSFVTPDRKQNVKLYKADI